MAFGLDKTNFLLDSLDFYKCVVDPTTDAIGSSVLIGHTEPEKSITITKQFAEFFRGVPETLVRRDLTRLEAGMDLMLKSWNIDTLDLVMNGEKELDKDGGGYDYEYLGSEPPVQNTSGFYLKGKTVSGREIYFVIRQGRITTEDTTIATGSTGEYSSLPVNIKAEIDEDVTDTGRNLCFWKIQNT